MKKYFLTFLSLAILSIGLTAQKLPKSVKDAKKAMNAANYTEALSLIDKALEDEATANMSEAWSVKGDILSGFLAADAAEIQKLIITQGQYDVKGAEHIGAAFDAYKTSLDKSSEGDKGSKASIKGLVGMVASLNEVGLHLYNGGKYDLAFNAFNTILKSRSLLSTIGNKSILSNTDDFNLMQYYAALSASNAGTPDKAMDLFQSLVDAGYNKPMPYQELFKAKIDTDEQAALDVLEKGSKACADDPDSQKAFLFSKINHYLKKGEYTKLENLIQDAIAAEPDNVSLYFALGTVYDQLYQGAVKDQDVSKSDEYFKEAEKYYSKTSELNKDHADAHYNLGAMYYNKATYLNDEIKRLDEDMSSAGMKRWEELKEVQKGHLLSSKPYFEKALQVNSNHTGAMTALKGISAYLNDKAGIDKYSKMLEAAGAN